MDMLYIGISLWTLFCIAATYFVVRQEYIYQVKDFLHLRIKALQSRWRLASRLEGYIYTLYVPISLRNTVYSWFIWKEGVDMKDVKDPDLTHYKSVNEFIVRPIREEARPIERALVVSPADCNANYFGKVDDAYVIENVKGNDYHLDDFMGKDVMHQVNQRLKQKPDSALFFAICYLSPADYHGFHAPTEWVIKFRRHFTGGLLSVREPAVGRIPDLFDINERMLLVGDWQHGFFSCTCVGAKMVGGIEFDFDHRHTNRPDDPLGSTDDRTYDPPVKKRKGEYFGKFLFGSTIVLVFQAPANFQFHLEHQQKIHYGQAMGTL